ncbi:hypothetical protein ACR79M_12335 [Sphingobacterium spiritivorum]|uniref:hypothetical protein n=1 Tax=Sphingobacterium spiritivorum TaxID=258 RepID=UPI003DA624AF
MNNLVYKVLMVIGCGALCLTSCSQPASKTNSGSDQYYFSLDSFFRSETSRLQKENPLISKTVAKDDEEESKSVKIKNWENELSAFTSSDINKRANVGLYKVENRDCDIIYTALQPGLSVQKIIIRENHQGEVKGIQIEKITNNILYSTEENLTYTVDSAYVIAKKQHIKLMGENSYHVSGKF